MAWLIFMLYKVRCVVSNLAKDVWIGGPEFAYQFCPMYAAVTRSEAWINKPPPNYQKGTFKPRENDFPNVRRFPYHPTKKNE